MSDRHRDRDRGVAAEPRLVRQCRRARSARGRPPPGRPHRDRRAPARSPRSRPRPRRARHGRPAPRHRPAGPAPRRRRSKRRPARSRGRALHPRAEPRPRRSAGRANPTPAGHELARSRSCSRAQLRGPGRTHVAEPVHRFGGQRPRDPAHAVLLPLFGQILDRRLAVDPAQEQAGQQAAVRRSSAAAAPTRRLRGSLRRARRSSRESLPSRAASTGTSGADG